MAKANSNNVKVRMLVSAGSATETWQPGDVMTLPAAAAKRMIESGQAESVEEKRTATNTQRETR